MVETFFGFKKTPFGDNPDAKQLFASQAWNQVKARLQFLVEHHGAGLITGEKRGRWVWWSIVPERVAEVRDALASAEPVRA